MNTKTLSALLAGSLAISGIAFAQDTIDGSAIKGQMEIDFPTRYQLDSAGEPKPGVKDTYKFTLSVAKTVEYSGSIHRVPRLTKDATLLRGERETQGNQLEYSVDIAVLNPNDPTQKKTVGKWVGVVPIDANGVYDLAGTTNSAHRIQIDTVGKMTGFMEKFSGSLVGRPTEKSESKALSFVREVAGKKIKIDVTNSDPMRFDNVVIAPGPSTNYPKAILVGSLDYDYDTGNWFANGLKFRYQLDGKDYEDVITGTIKWVEDPNRDTNGKGQYEFNLRVNEAKSQSTTEADAFANLSDEEAFFAVDNSIPAMTGTVAYHDTMDGDGRVTQSKVTYDLVANKLTKQQIVNFSKLLLVAVGPFNDE